MYKMLPFMLKSIVCMYSLESHYIPTKRHPRNWWKHGLGGGVLVTRGEKRDWDHLSLFMQFSFWISFHVHSLPIQQTNGKTGLYCKETMFLFQKTEIHQSTIRSQRVSFEWLHNVGGKVKTTDFISEQLLTKGLWSCRSRMYIYF